MHKTALHCYNYLYLASLAGKKMKKAIMHLCLSFTLVIATLNWQVLFVCDSFYDIYISYVQPFGDFFPTTQGVGPWKLSCKRILNGVDYVNRKPFRLGPGAKLQLHHQHQQRQFLMVTQVRSTGFLRRFKPVYSILVDHFLWRTTTCSTLGALGLKKTYFFCALPRHRCTKENSQSDCEEGQKEGRWRETEGGRPQADSL